MREKRETGGGGGEADETATAPGTTGRTGAGG
jgi:hypothetical protein